MKMADNIGGVPSCWYALLDHIKDCVPLDDGIMVIFNPGKSWTELPATPNKTDVQVTPADDNTGMYEVSITISIPDYKFDSRLQVELNNRFILFKYQTANGETFIVGDKENFLKTSTQRLSPGIASGYAGLQINVSGKLSHQELPSL